MFGPAALRGNVVLSEAETEKTLSLAKIEKSNAVWMVLAVNVIQRISPGSEGIGEDFRHAVASYIGRPTRPNAWGALIRKATTLGLLELTGEMRSMRDRRSHARKSWVYRRTNIA